MLIELNYNMNDNGYETKAEYGELVISGEDQHGFRPFFLLVSSIVGCIGTGLRREINNLGSSFKDIKVKANVTRNEEEANRVEKIHLIFTVYSNDLSIEKLEDAMKKTLENSAMTQTVNKCINITADLYVERVK